MMGSLLPVRVRTCLRATHRQAQTGRLTHSYPYFDREVKKVIGSKR